MVTILQQREIFHLEFLRALNRMLKPGCYVLKGGTNLRFFFGSIRYSEDMDIDVRDVPVGVLKDKVMEILKSSALRTVLKSFRIGDIVPPDMGKAKQTETVQRFKTHLITDSGEDLFTKVEFSRRGVEPAVKTETVLAEITRLYRIGPLIVPHYALETALAQKIRALADRRQVQARDVFDVYVLLGKGQETETLRNVSREKLAAANRQTLAISCAQYRDTVVEYLSEQDREHWGREDVWDEMVLRVSAFLERLAVRKAG